MNFQDFVEPIGDMFVWVFEAVVEPIGDGIGRRGFQVGAVSVGLAGLALWLTLQGKYNKAAKDNPDQRK